MAEKVVIVGGGLAGLSCARRLHEAQVEYVLLEASDALGGRVRTDAQDGFLLDRGFQVFLSAYPEAGELLDLEALDLRRFKPGALIFKDGRFRRLMDVFRAPWNALSTALQPVGSIKDKLLVGKLRLGALDLFNREPPPDQTTEDFLRSYGFSEGMIDTFFRAFYGGIFLERDLRTSSRMFEFTFKMFARGFATLPANGMQEIPRQLATPLSARAIRLNSPARAVDRHGVTLTSGERIASDSVVVATDLTSVTNLLPGFSPPHSDWRSVTGLYYSAPRSPLREPIIALNGEGNGLVNNVCVLSDVAPSYAPEGSALISVSLLGLPQDRHLEETVRKELRAWFGDQVEEWQHLRTDRIPHALPEQRPTTDAPERAAFREHQGVTICGDHCSSASIEGALVSGRQAAEAILAR